MMTYAVQIDEVTLSRKLTNPQATVQPVEDTVVLSLREYLGYVKRHHPVALQAELLLDEGQANLLQARGGFDPKIEVDYRRKDFKDIEYYDELTGVFKIPTWYGVEFKAGAERNEGEFLDPSLTVPDGGLYSAGVQVNLGQGLWINERMATLRKAKLFQQQSQADRDLAVNAVLYDASNAYFEWWRATQEVAFFKSILANAIQRKQAVVVSARLGDKAAIDTVEAGIAVQTRRLSLEKAQIQLTKRRLQVSNFLWLDGVPVELQDNVVPQEQLQEVTNDVLALEGQQLNEFNVENHPKIVSLNFKLDQLDVDRQLKANKLLPKVTVDYNFITPDWNELNSINQNNYKAGLTFAYPIFTRKERGDLRLAKIKIDDARYGLQSESLILRNKVIAIFNELDSYQRQVILADELVNMAETMLRAENRKFELGDSSLFIINSREAKLIDSQVKALEVQEKLLSVKAELFRSLMVLPENL
ncbi:TolC family protein [Nonlabens ponticola]|nr:TolC family protein [Nonlabens ponticola]